MYTTPEDMLEIINGRAEFVARDIRSTKDGFAAVKRAARSILRWIMQRNTTKNRPAAIGEIAWQG